MEDISFDDFLKMDLRIAEIKACEEIPGADKLYEITVDVGEERQIVAGMKPFYSKEALIGKKIVMITNLAPRKIRGITSHGMLLAASTEDKSSVVLLTTDIDIPNGSRVS